MVGMVLLDLQKAFDTVNHDILLMKLQAIGLSSDIVNWFRSYLSDRLQTVNISNISSSPSKIRCSVPQGSILGPLLFLIYVNDMSAVVKNKLLLYADDSAILVSGKNKDQITSALSKDLEFVSHWLVDNKLSLHLGKTESILFGSKPKLKTGSDLDIFCNGTKIKSTKSVKYLGATLDQHLSCESMANEIIKKASSRLKFLYRKKSFLTSHTRKLLVSCLIQCHFDYACCFWFHSITKKCKDRLQIIQNKCIRFVLNLDPRTHLDVTHFNRLNWLPVQKRVESITLSNVYKVKHNIAPEYLKEHFIPADSVHSYNTRFSENGCFSIPKVKGFGMKTFSYNGCKLWNNLPTSVKNINKLADFKLAVRKHMYTEF
jgi:hypothetical protein